MAYFIAVIPQNLKNNDELRRLMSKYKRTINDREKEVRWVPSDLWHVTIQYLGELNREDKNKVREFFKNWQPSAVWKNIEIRIQSVGAFPSVYQARVLWLGIKKNQSLLDAQDSLREDIEPLGLAHDDREYTPHLTLARFRNPMHASFLTELGGRKHFGDYKVTELLLLESVVEGHMTKYVPIERKLL